MSMRHSLFGLLVAFAFILGAGCEKSGSGGQPSAAVTPTRLSPDTIVRVHWLGKNDLGIKASAYYFMRIWELPQSAQLEVQALNRLSDLPWRRLQGQNNVTSQPGTLLYPLLVDVIWNESYFEIRQAANEPAEFVLAVRLDAPHEQLWKTNLATVAESLTGIRPVPASDGRFGWALEKHGPPAHIALTRVGQWTLVSAGPEQNGLLDDMTARIQRDRTPYVSQKPDDWLEANIDLPRLGALLPQPADLPADLPKISLAITGDGGRVLTHADLLFPEPLQLELPPWEITTNLIHQPLVGFAAVRGIALWLAASKKWNDLQMGPPPDQLYSWALPNSLFQTYFAAPLPDSDSQVRALTAHLLARTNPWLAAHGYVGFDPNPDSNGVTWGTSPSILPFVKSVAADGKDGVAYGGLIPETKPDANAQTNLFYYHPSFAELLQDLSARTNLVYYQWELTGNRIQSCLYIGQFLSAISRHTPLSLDSLSAGWLKTIVPRLGNSTTTFTLVGTNQLSFDRSSTVGLTAAELNLLAIWLESPGFPGQP